jgi:hypothetical protein
MRKISFQEILLFFEAWVILGFARLILIFLPFKKIALFLGKENTGRINLDKSDITMQKTIQAAISRGSRFSFWRTKCFEQALAAKFMLKKRNFKSTIHFGVARLGNERNLAAHAWLESNGYIVTGARGHNNFSIINSFTD